MAEVHCAACEDIKQNVPEFVANGFTEEMCASMKNDTGLKASVGHNDCTDLDNLNDCLIGNMETQVESYDVCEWKDFIKPFINNLWTTLKAMICAICGIWTNIHSLWETIRSFCITNTGHTINLTSNLGTHCSVTVPDNDTTYDLTQNGNTVSLVGSDGSVDTVNVSGTTYDLTISDHNVSLVGSDGSVDTVTVPDADTQYQLHTKTYTLTNVAVVAGDTAVVDVAAPQPTEYTDTLYPMAVAGWTWEGTFASYLVTRYIQLVDRSGSPKVRVAVRNIASPAGDGSHDASVTLYVEVLWWGLRTA